jgi:hypothetical protein
LSFKRLGSQDRQVVSLDEVLASRMAEAVPPDLSG